MCLKPSKLWQAGTLHLSPSWIMKMQTLDLIITAFNPVVTETASEILGKHHQRKNPESLQNFLICAIGENWERNYLNLKDLRNTGEWTTILKKQNWIGEQCSEIEENLRKNNSKRAYQLVKDLTTVTETRKSYYCLRSFRKMPHRRTRDTKPMDRMPHWTVQSQGQWKSINTGRSPDRHRGWPPHLSQRSGGCSTISEEREVGWSRVWQSICICDVIMHKAGFCGRSVYYVIHQSFSVH